MLGLIIFSNTYYIYQAFLSHISHSHFCHECFTKQEWLEDHFLALSSFVLVVVVVINYVYPLRFLYLSESISSSGETSHRFTWQLCLGNISVFSDLHHNFMLVWTYPSFSFVSHGLNNHAFMILPPKHQCCWLTLTYFHTLLNIVKFTSVYCV